MTADTDRMVAEAFELEAFRRSKSPWSLGLHEQLQRALTILAAPDAIDEQSRCNNCGVIESPGVIHGYGGLGSCWLAREDPS